MTKASIITAIASTAIAGIVALADKRIKERDEDRAAIKRGYVKTYLSKMAGEGLKMGEFCITDDELAIAMFGDDCKEPRVYCRTATFYIYNKVEYNTELDPGFYAVRTGGTIRKAFYDGKECIYFISGADDVKVTRQLDIESAALLKVLKKKLEELEADNEKASKKHTKTTNTAEN